MIATDPCEQLRSAMREHGLIPPHTLVGDGKLRRFPSNGKPGDDAGWYVLHNDGVPAGRFGDWRSGIDQPFRADLGRTLTPAEERRARESIEHARRQRELDDTSKRARASELSAALWNDAGPVDADHAYLVRKAVAAPKTLRQITAERAALTLGYPPRSGDVELCGRLLLAPVKIGDKLSTLELIDEDGRKSGVYGGAKRGGFWASRLLPDAEREPRCTILIGEGVATVLSAVAATEYCGLAALTSGNLLAVAGEMRKRYPNATLVVLGEPGTGEEKAREAVRETGAVLALPAFTSDERASGASDMNDLQRLRGPDAVGAAIRSAIDSARSASPTGTPDRAAGAVLSGPRVRLVCADTITPKSVRWVWEGWLAAGKMAICAGQPGTGKTTLALAMAATVSCGGVWPDGSCALKGHVIIWSGEDDIDDTIVPRLRAMAADMSHVHIVHDTIDGVDARPFDPARDMAPLVTIARTLGGVALMIIDPIVMVITGDSHKNAEVRRGLQCVVDLARELDCAVLGVTHFTKGTQGREPIERVTGSNAFAAVARIVLAAAKLPPEEASERGDRILIRAKSNVGQDYGGFKYALHADALREFPSVTASSVMWGDAVDGSARELLAKAEAEPPPANETQNDAEELIRETLRNGPTLAKEIIEAAEAHGISRSRLHRAKDRLHIRPKKDGMDGRWIWALPGQTGRHPEDSEDSERPEDPAHEEVGTSADGDVEAL